MIERTTRPMTGEEVVRASALPRQGTSFRRAAHAGLAFYAGMSIVGGLAMALAAILLPEVARTRVGPMQAMGGGTFVGVLLVIFLRRRFGAKAKLDPIDADLESAQVNEIRVEASAARLVPERSHADAPAFVLDIGQGELLFVRGAHLAPLVKAGKFPCTRFTLARLPARDLTIAITCEGEPLPVPEEPPVEPAPGDESIEGLGDGDSFTARLETWRDELRHI